MGIGMKLQKLREEAGLSQSELARRAGVSIDSLRNWEQDRALPKIDAATKLARALSVSLDEFAINGGEEPSAAKKSKAAPAVPPAAELEATAEDRKGRKQRAGRQKK